MGSRAPLTPSVHVGVRTLVQRWRVLLAVAIVATSVGLSPATAFAKTAPTISISGPNTVTTSTATFSYAINRGAHQIASLTCALDGPVTNTNCGTLASTRHSTIGTVTLAGLSGGAYRYTISVVLKGGGTTSASVSFDVSAPVSDLGISLTDGVTSVTPGTPDSYTITLENFGPSNVSGATVIDTLPTGFLSASSTSLPTGVAFTDLGNGQVEWTNVATASGATTTLTLSGTVDSSLAAGTNTFFNSATVIPPNSTTDSNLTNNTAADTDNVV